MNLQEHVELNEFPKKEETVLSTALKSALEIPVDFNIFQHAISASSQLFSKLVTDKSRNYTAICHISTSQFSSIYEFVYKNFDKFVKILENHGDSNINKLKNVGFKEIMDLVVKSLSVLTYFYSRSNVREVLNPNLEGEFAEIHRENVKSGLLKTNYQLSAIPFKKLDSNGCKFFDILVKMNLVFVTAYEADLEQLGKRKKTRRYAVLPSFLKDFLEINSMNTNENDLTAVDISEVTKLGYVPKEAKSIRIPMYGNSRKNARQEKANKTKKGFYIPLNLDALREHIKSFGIETREDIDRLSEAEKAAILPELARLRFLLRELEQVAYVDSYGNPFYYSEYLEQPGGRLTEIDGLQNLPTKVKNILFKGFDVHNYDIEKCHPTVVCQVLKCYGHKPEFLEGYINNSITRADMAMKIFNSTHESCILGVKSLINSACYGMTRGEGYTLTETLETVKFEADIETSVSELHQKTLEVLAPLYQELDVFASVVKQYISKNSKTLNGLKTVTLPNGNVMKFNAKMDRKELITFRFHFITCYESYMIQKLIKLIQENCKAHECRPLINMHDGLITLGKIPDHVLKMTTEGDKVFPMCKIVKKPL